MTQLIRSLLQLPFNVAEQQINQLGVRYGQRYQNKLITVLFGCLHGVC